jgi:hypothetical protein
MIPEFLYNGTLQISILLIIASVSSCIINIIMMRRASTKISLWLNSTAYNLASQLGLSLDLSKAGKGGVNSGITRNIAAGEKRVKDMILNVPEIAVLNVIASAMGFPDFKSLAKDLPAEQFIPLILKYENLLPNNIKKSIQASVPIFDPNLMNHLPSPDKLSNDQQKGIIDKIKPSFGEKSKFGR